MVSLTNLSNNAKGMGVFAIVVAVTLAILQGFQANNGSIIGGNASTAYTTITSFVTALGSYATWAAIIVLAIVGYFLLRYMGKAR